MRGVRDAPPQLPLLTRLGRGRSREGPEVVDGVPRDLDVVHCIRIREAPGASCQGYPRGACANAWGARANTLAQDM